MVEFLVGLAAVIYIWNDFTRACLHTRRRDYV